MSVEVCHCWRENTHGPHGWTRVLSGEQVHCPGLHGDGTDATVGDPPRITKINGRKVAR